MEMADNPKAIILMNSPISNERGEEYLKKLANKLRKKIPRI
jgi:hypothetical protein